MGAPAMFSGWSLGHLGRSSRPWLFSRTAPCAYPTLSQGLNPLPPLPHPSKHHYTDPLSQPAPSQPGSPQPGPSHPAASEPAPRQPGVLSDPAVAHYLEEQGVCTTQLEREHPESYAQLTLPLAQLLVEALAARQRLQTKAGSGSSSSLAPAEVAVRLVFLACEVGLPLGEVERRYVAAPANLQFKMGAAREALGWLRPLLRPEQLRRVAVWHPSVWKTTLGTLRASKDALQQLFEVSDGQWAEAVYGFPALVSTSLTTAQGVVHWLRSEAVGMAPPEVMRLFKRKPELFKRRPDTLSKQLEYLLGRLGIPRAKAPSLVRNSTGAVLLSQDALEKKVDAFVRHGFTPEEVGRVILGAPLLLNCGFDAKILPALAELEALLQPEGAPAERRRSIIRVVLKGSSLVTVRSGQLRRNFAFLQEAGLSVGEARAMLRATPQVFYYSLDGPLMRAKLRYYEHVLGLGPRDMLLRHCSYLKEGLAKVDQRVFCMERRGELQLLTERDGSKLVWILDPSPKFCTKYGVSPRDWEACKAAWQESERAKEYGLVGAGRKKKGFGNDYTLISVRNKAVLAQRQ